MNVGQLILTAVPNFLKIRMYKTMSMLVALVKLATTGTNTTLNARLVRLITVPDALRTVKLVSLARLA